MKTRNSIQRALIATAAASTLAGALVACSAAEPSDTMPTESGSWALAYASCMRDQGIEMDDPNEDDSSFVVTMPDGVSEESFNAADLACTKRLGERPAPDGGNKTEDEYFEQELAAIRCLRDAGYDVADPVRGEGFSIDENIPDDVVADCLSSFQLSG